MYHQTKVNIREWAGRRKQSPITRADLTEANLSYARVSASPAGLVSGLVWPR